MIEEVVSDEPFIQTYWAHGSHIGEAIANALYAARNNGLSNPKALAVDPYDIRHLKCEVHPSREAEVFWNPARLFFPPESTFIFPTGIIRSCTESESEENPDPDDIAAGFSVSKNDQGMTSIEVNVSQQNLLDLYEALLKIRPQYRVFWYIIHDHWDDKVDHFLTNEAVNTPERILSHIRSHRNDSLHNGYVTLTSYLEEGATNLNISDHKRIMIETYSNEIAEEYASCLLNRGYDESNKPVSIDCCVHHWHYRPPGSRSREELVNYLHGIGFEDWSPRT